MKKIPIKFRGIEDIKDGKYVYGDYVTRQDGCAIRVKTSASLFNLHEYEIAVKPETIAQLIGYDADGKEIYEGDKVFDADNNAVTAAFYPNAHYKSYTKKKVNL